MSTKIYKKEVCAIIMFHSLSSNYSTTTIAIVIVKVSQLST